MKRDRRPLVVNTDGFNEELRPNDTLDVRLSGEYADTIPLPDALARHMFLCQGRGMRISTDGRLLATKDFRVDTNSLSLPEGVRNLRVWLDKEVWEWDSAGKAWLRHELHRGA